MNQEKEGNTPDPGDVSVVIRPGDESEPPPPQQLPMGAISVSIEAGFNGEAEQLAHQAGADAIIVDTKTDTGLLHWKSPLAIACNGRATTGVVGMHA